MLNTVKLFLVLLLCIALIGYSHAAFQCYRCNDCGNDWNPSKAAMALTETGTSFCTKRVANGKIYKDYSVSCTAGNGVYCCQDELCNSSNSNYKSNLIVFIAFAIIGFITRKI